MLLLFFFKQKTAYDMRISDWSSDVCSSDLDESLPWQSPGHGSGRSACACSSGGPRDNETCNPGNRGENHRSDDHGIARSPRRRQIEPGSGIPYQVPNAVAEMVEQRPSPADQQQQAEPRTDEALRRGKGLRARYHPQPPQPQNPRPAKKHKPP